MIEAPVDRVWDLLTQPGGFDNWIDATLVTAEPGGEARPGQQLHFVTKAVGWTFPVTIDVREVDAGRGRLHFVVALPFGIVNDEVMTVADLGNARTLVRFA